MQTNKALVVFLALCVSSLVFAVEVHAGSNVNLAVIPNSWHLTYSYGPQIISLDYTVVRTPGKPSIRLAPHTSADRNYARECDGTWYAAKPGDHIVAKCWIKIDPLPSGYTYEAFAGARIGIDCYGRSNCILCETVGPGYPNTDTDEKNQYVHWGTSGWVQRTIDFIVPASYFTYDYATKRTIPPTQIDEIVMYLQVWSGLYDATEPGNAWFADAELYINPDFTSSAGAPPFLLGVPPVPNQSLFNDGFETGTTSAYSWNSGSPTIVNNVQHSGSYSCRFSSCYCYLAKAGLAHDTLYTTVYARINALPPASGNFVTVLRGENVNEHMIYRLFFYNKAGVLTISLTSYTPTWSRIDYSLPYVVNAWYCFKVKYSVNNEVRYWVNGVEAGARTGIDSTSLGQQDHVLVGQLESNYATSVWVDDVTLSNSP